MQIRRTFAPDVAKESGFWETNVVLLRYAKVFCDLWKLVHLGLLGIAEHSDHQKSWEAQMCQDASKKGPNGKNLDFWCENLIKGDC